LRDFEYDKTNARKNIIERSCGKCPTTYRSPRYIQDPNTTREARKAGFCGIVHTRSNMYIRIGIAQNVRIREIEYANSIGIKEVKKETK